MANTWDLHVPRDVPSARYGIKELGRCQRTSNLAVSKKRVSACDQHRSVLKTRRRECRSADVEWTGNPPRIRKFLGATWGEWSSRNGETRRAGVCERGCWIAGADLNATW